MDEAGYDKKMFVLKSEHDRQVEVLENVIGSMLRMAGQADFEAHIGTLDGFGESFEVTTELQPNGQLVVRTQRRGIVPARAAPTVPLGLLKRMP